MRFSSIAMLLALSPLTSFAQEVTLQSDDGTMESMWSLTAPAAGPADWIGVTYASPYEHPFRVVRAAMFYLDTFCCVGSVCSQSCGDAGIPDFEESVITGANLVVDPSGLTPDLLTPVALQTNVVLLGAGATATQPPWTLTPHVWTLPANTIFDRPGRVFFAMKYFPSDTYMKFAVDSTSVNLGTSINSSDGFSTRSAIWSFGNVGMRIDVAPLFNLKASATTPPASFQLADAQSLTMLAFRISGEQATSVTRVRVTASGSGDDRLGVAQVRLVVDANDDGISNAGETTLATGSFAVNNGTVDLQGFSRDLGNARAEKWLVVYDLAGTASGGQTFAARVAAPADVSSSIGSPYFSGALDGAAVTVAGRLVAERGPQTPPDSFVPPSSTAVPALQLRLRANNEGFRLSRLDVSAQGSMNDVTGLANVRVHRDADSSGTITTGDTLLATGAFATNDGSVSLSFAPVTIAANASADFVISADVTGVPVGGDQLRFLVTAPGSVGADGLVSGPIPTTGPRSLTGLPVIGNAITIGGALTVAAGAANPGASTAQPGTTAVPMLQLSLSAAAEAIDLGSLTIAASGSGDEVLDVARARLFKDTNGNGIVDASDAAIGTPATFAANDGSLTFGFAPETIPQGGTVLWLLAYDFTSEPTGGETFRARVTSAASFAATGHVSRAVVTPSGSFPIQGGIRTLLGGFSLTVAPSNPVASRYQPGRAGAPVLVTQLAAQGEAFDVSRIRLSAAGTLDDRTALVSVKIHRDLGTAGALDASDVLLGSGTFDSDDGVASIDFAPAVRILSGVSERWLVTYDLGSAPSGSTFRARITTAADLTVSGSLSGATSASGLPISSDLHSVGGTLVLAPGPANPAGGSIAPDATAVVFAQVRAQALIEPIAVSSVRIRAAGTGNEITDVARARLYADADHDGVVDAVGDVPLGSTAVFTADDGSVTFAFTARTIPAGAFEDWLVAYDLSGAATAGSTFSARIELPTDVVATAPSGALPGVSGSPVGGGAITVLGSLRVDRAPESPPARFVQRGSSAVPVLSVDVRGSAESFVLHRITFEAAGSADDPNDLDAVTLLVDVDHDGSPSAGDLPAGDPARFTGDDGSVSFDGLAIPIGQSRTSLLLVASFASGVESGRSFRALLRSAASMSVSGLGGRAVTEISGLPVSSSPVTIGGTLDVGLGPQPPLPRVVRRGDRAEPAVQLRLTASLESATVESVTLHGSGTFDDARAIELIELYLDANGNGIVDSGEARLSSGRFGGDDGAVTLAVGQVAQPASPLTLLARVDVSGAPVGGESFRIRIDPETDVLVSSASGSVTPRGAIVLGPTLTAGGGLVVALGGAQTAGDAVNQNELAVPVLQLDVLADNEPCTIDTLTISAAGSIDDSADIASVRLLRDTNQNGLVDAFDVELSSPRRFGADDGSITFNGLQRALGTDAREAWLVAYDLTGTASNLETFRARILGESDVGVTCTFSGVVDVSGPPIDGPVFTVEEGGALVVTRANETPAASFVPRGSVRAPALGLRLVARVRPVSIDFITLTASAAPSVIELVELFRDTNRDGHLDRADQLIGSGQVSGGRVALSTTGLGVDPSEPVYLLAVASVRLAAQPGQRFALGLTAASDAPATSALGSVPTVLAPFWGETMTVAGDLNVALGSSTPTLIVHNDDTSIVALDLALEAPTEGFTLHGIVVSAFGTADPARAIREVKLLADDGDGIPEPADRALASGLTFAEGERRVSASGLDERIESSRPLRILVVIDLDGTAPVDASLTFSVAANVDIVATGDRVGPTSAVGAPLSGPTLIIGGSLVATAGTLLEPRVVSASARDIVALTLALSAHNEDVTISRLSLRIVGTLDDSKGIESARLFHDANTNGMLDSSDAEIALATVTSDDGVLSFTPLAEQIGRGTTRYLLAAINLSGAGSAGESFSISFASDADVTAFGAVSGAVGASGAPVEGPGIALVGALNARLGPASPPGAGEVPGAKFPAFQLSFSSQGESVVLDQLALRIQGTANDDAAIEKVELFRDQDSDGVVGDGDTIVAEGAPDGDDGRIAFPNLGHRLAPNTETTLLAVLRLGDDASPGGTLRLLLATNDDIRATGESSGPIVAVGAPVTGSEFTIIRAAESAGPGGAPPDEGCSCANVSKEPRSNLWAFLPLFLVAVVRRRLTAQSE
ncbi:MAG: hypothetical protein HYV07_16440 [Deltaproteobacteria bacterium]|nr:hypothetical protein [Deltaproteobacteria bacterium]